MQSKKETTKKLRKQVVPDEILMSKIYLVRGHKIMLDSDLAELYRVETKNLKRQVSRNYDRFPKDFMFELTADEFENLRCQIGTSKNWGGTRHLPMVFTEHGVLMLSSVLSSKQAIQMNIQIMRIFARIRQTLFDSTNLRLAIEQVKKKTNRNTKNIEVVFQYLDEFLESKNKPMKRKKIGYKVAKK